MSRHIWKYKFRTTDEFTIDMPHGSRILDIQTQDYEPCMWAEVDNNYPLITRIFRIYGTGHELPNKPGDYIKTYQEHDGGLIWHVYEITQPS